MGEIHIKGARQHNLKDVEVRIPRDQLTVITGVSGSGKSSLAFDTLYAEGYRQYIDSLSPRARSVLEQLPRPDVDFIHGLSPVIAVEQHRNAGASPRSTVATVTEIADYARLLWSVAGEAHCPKDGGRIIRRSLDDAVHYLLQLGAERNAPRAMLLAPYLEAKPSVLRGELPHLRQRGFQRVRIGGQIVEIDRDDALPSGAKPLQLDLVIDRLVLREDQRSRIADSLELAFREAQDQALVLVQAQDGQGDAVWTDEQGRAWEEVIVSQHLACEICGTTYAPVTPKTFSWNHPDGACPTCGGLGKVMRFEPELLVPDPTLSVKKGAIKPLRLGSKRMIIQHNAILKQLAEQLPFDANTPWQDLPEEVREVILRGAGDRLFQFKLKPGNSKPEEKRWQGVLALIDEIRRETSSEGLKARLVAYQSSGECPDCHGARLKAEARHVFVAGHTFNDFLQRDLTHAHDFVQTLEVEPGQDYDAFADVVNGLKGRLHFLNEVGLGYLSLDREYASLSGGEAQRARLATQLGLGLVGVTYVLDEPTIGLHPYDTAALVRTLEDLRDRGNTVVVVEHDEDVMHPADYLLEFGPGAGDHGGHLIFSGTVEAAKADAKSLTGRFLSGREQVEKNAETLLPGRLSVPKNMSALVPREVPGLGDRADWVVVEGAHEHNLRDVDVSFPVGLLTCVTGVSGSGKSTLVNDILGEAAARALNRAKSIPGRHRGLKGLEHFERLVRVDQSPIGRSPRSNPATYTKIFDELRALYAQTPLSKVRGYGPSRFSFNVRGGRCERCQGDGMIKLDMQFLNDVYTECPSCHGQRYNRETLEVRFRGLSIAEVLGLTVDEAYGVFQRVPKLATKLETLQAVGLGYLRLGQAAHTLSGGEAQRIKLALELSKRTSVPTLYLLDEPTTGLHWSDIQQLMDLLFRLRDQGHTVIVIEHQLDVIRLADWVIDLGPGGGEEGGELLYAGPPAGLKAVERSRTGRCL
ncbi:MAG: excinuclease ABC subunit A [Puniceicoccaceae bacterium 5H]|nr:MAG: excinuclease ABC subunit A [Puniceicoccaceae bacterium 5H]